MQKLSVIIPIYNVEPYLERCLNSVVNQTFRDMEIICVNDGSTDGSMAILNRYALADDRIIIIDQKNQGLSAARNAGLDKAAGEYVLFVDSDDELAPEACTRLFSLAKPEHDAIMFGTSVRCADDSTPPIETIRYLDIPAEGPHAVDDSMLVRLSVNAWNKMYRRDAIERLKLRFPLGCLYEDAVFFYCFFSVYRSIYFIKDKLYIYYWRNDSIMGATRQKKENYGIYHIFLFDWIYDFWNRHGVFQGREDVFCERFTTYIRLAFNSSPDHEKARCIWEATRRIRAWGLDTSRFPLLERLKNGACPVALVPPSVPWQTSLLSERDEMDKKINFIWLYSIRIYGSVLYWFIKVFSKVTSGQTRKNALAMKHRMQGRLKILSALLNKKQG